ncbi:MAG: response regulator [Desulfobulbaceae bacterium]|nr:response regulator [Desulfobulbaceae bacterium]HIJ90591.1 response regulator [Deltaproteobacteria bacterium]
MKILIAEDDFLSRKLLTKHLSTVGEIDIAVNGVEAVNAVQLELKNNGKYDLICLDIMMPQMDGQQALSEIRRLEGFFKLQREQGAKIFMTTSSSDKDHVVKAALAGCDAYLIKPITKVRLFGELAKHGLTSVADNFS